MTINLNILEIAGCRNLIGVMQGASDLKRLFQLWDLSTKLKLDPEEERTVTTQNMELVLGTGTERSVELTPDEVIALRDVLNSSANRLRPADTMWLRPLMEKLK